MVYKEKPANPRRGDFFIFPQLDSIGRANIAGRHTNFGYSGFIVVLIFDGNYWANLTRACREAIGIAKTEFSYQYEKRFVLDRVEKCIIAFQHANQDCDIRSWWYKSRKYATLTPVAKST